MSTSASSEPLARAGLGRARAALLIAALLGLQPVTTDLYVPALPLLARELGASMAAAQQTMGALLLAFGFGQLLWGPVADRVGRRPVLLAGLALYALASLAGAVAADVHALVLCRVAQGLGLASAVVCARAVLRDLFHPAEGTRIMAWALTGLGGLALASPLAGGLLAAHVGWRSTLAVVAACGALVLALVSWQLPETLPARRLDALKPASMLAAWHRIAAHPEFRAWALLTTCAYGGLFTMLAGAPFVYVDVLGHSAASAGALMALASVSYICGTFACRRWVRQVGPARAVQRAGLLSAASAVALAAPVLAGWSTVWTLAVPVALYTFAHGVHQPCSQAGAVGPFPAHAGTASALAGFATAVVAFGTGLWLGQAMDGTARPVALGIAFWGLAVAATAWTLVRRLPPGPR